MDGMVSARRIPSGTAITTGFFCRILQSLGNLPPLDDGRASEKNEKHKKAAEIFLAISLEDDPSRLRLNIEAYVRLTKYFLPAMLERRYGRIFNTASFAGF
jgi:NAD(P)-dependent dehydrogenase (short-subunit alcohol dehydrogenase family)